ncbi:MAG: hypothetical protein AAGA25_09950 [Planctomycetota bacterium]
MKSFFTLCGVLALTLAATGCVKFKQAWVINPDGSGKMTMTFGVSEQMLAMAGDDDPFADLDDPSDMMDQEDNGWVAFTKPEIKTENGFKYATFVGYFEDINQVTFSGDGGNGEMVDSTYSLADGTFTVTNGMLGQVIATMANDPQMQDPQMKAMMAPMMAGMEMTESYLVPGEVTGAEGYEADGKTASTTLTAEDMLGNTPPSIDGLDDGQLTITFTPGPWPEQDAWAAELAKAKTDWEAIKESAAAGAGAE